MKIVPNAIMKIYNDIEFWGKYVFGGYEIA